MKKIILLLAASLAACSSTAVRRDSRTATRPAKQSPLPSTQASSGRKALPPKQSAAPNGPALLEEARRAAEAERKGDYLAALKDYLSASVNAPEPAQQENYRLKALELLETRLDEGSLRSVSADAEYGFLRGHALYQLGHISAERHQTEDAKKYFSSVVSFLPGTDLAFQAEEALAQLESVRYVEPKTIGVVLPLSGRNAAIGQRALRGIELGLGLNDANSNFKLAIMDSEGNPDTARRGVERLVKEDNVIAIIGSLLSKTAPAVAAKAEELGVPTIGLSQKAGLTEAGPTVFRNALTGEMQVRQLVRSSMDELGLRRFAILAPNDPYGVEYANIFWDEVLARGGSITAVQFYSAKDTDYRAVCERLAGKWYIEAREDEYKMLVREQKAPDSKKKSSIRQEKSADDVLPAIVDFDAVFIPDSAKMMTQMAAYLSYAGVRNVKLLGTNLWNSPGIGKRAGLFADSLVFVDSWQGTGGDESKAPRFVSDYKQLFNEEPTLIEIQAYDSALILRSMILQGAAGREEITRRLTDLRKFPGALGPLEMSPQREIRRPLVTYQTLQNGQISVLKRKTN